jgi:hypothetical protein
MALTRDRRGIALIGLGVSYSDVVDYNTASRASLFFIFLFAAVPARCGFSIRAVGGDACLVPANGNISSGLKRQGLLLTGARKLAIGWLGCHPQSPTLSPDSQADPRIPIFRPTGRNVLE